MLHQIGIGTLGPVFRTYEPTRDRLVAVKVFRLDIVPEQAQALAAALSRAVQGSLFHPSIVEPIDAGVEGTLAYRAEEYVAAESLDVAMRHYAPAPIEKVLPFMTQLAGAIDFARAAGIGHGGLHPRDIFVTPDEARATGFGVVEALEQVGIRAPIRRPYSAPERIDGGAWSTPADVFSLAAITFELLTGKRPSGTGAQIGSLPDGEHTAAVHAVLARAMDDDPGRRYASALAFAGALEAASQGRQVTDSVEVLGVHGVREVRGGHDEPELPLVLDTPAVAPIAEAQMDVHEPVPVELAAAPGPVVDEAAGEFEPETAGEFAIEARLDPVHAALEDVAQYEQEPAPAPLLFDETPERERFADDFVEDQHAEADMRSPLEDEPPLAPPAPMPAETPMFQTSEPEVEAVDLADRGRPAVLPYALVAVPALLVGFAGGYFIGSRERIVTPQEITQSTATPDKPGNYSEQKVAAPAPAPTPSTETPSASAPAATAPPAAAAAKPAPVPREPATARAAAAQKGQIVVRSLPSHAGVTVNGTWRGRTPLTLDGLTFGNYVVRVVQPGYVVAREAVTLDARAPSHTFTTRLERASRSAPPAPVPSSDAAVPASGFTGSLYVDSRPRGAKVTVDGRSVGQTPVSVPDVRAGTHVLRIEMDGKKPVTATPRIVSGKMERVTVSLEDK